MSIFTSIPSEFPFEIELSSQPVRFRLQADRGDVIVSVVLALFWIALGPFLIVFLMEIPASWFPAPDLWLWLQIGLCGTYLIWAILFYFGPEILDQLRTVDVTIADNQVSVVDCRLKMCRQWSEPLSAFEGVGRHDLGTRLIDDEKIPITSVVLQHPDPSRTVPLVFREQNKIGKKTVEKLAGQLKLQALEGVTSGNDTVTHEAGVIVVNRYQALKVRVLYWFIEGVGAMMLGSLAYHGFISSFKNEMALLVALCIATMGAMHVYASCYITSMHRHGDIVTITTTALLGSNYAIPRSRFTSKSYHKGKLTTVRHRINAPWMTVRIEGFFLPFIVDLQSDYVFIHGLNELTRNRK